jgi:C-terminal processing protease CtpA/Prc
VLESYFGLRRVPLDFRLVENRTVITRVFPRLFDGAFDLHVGDVITHIDGVPTETKRATLRKLLPGANEATLERNVHDSLQRTNAARLRLTVEGQDGRTSTWDVNTVALRAPWEDMIATHGDVSAILPGNVGYVHMAWLQVADVAGVMARLRDTRGIVFDVRYYPNGTLYALSNYLNPTLRPFAKFQEPDFDHPGHLVWTPIYFAGPGSPNSWGAPPASYTYTGRVVVLVNEETLSQAEFTVMALRTAPDATVIGSQTAGADGNVSAINLPGQISTGFTGLGVFYPDGTPTQRVGIVPDIVVKPTIEGLREGRDEVLEAALALLD